MVCNFRADNCSIEKAKKATEFCEANQIFKKPDFLKLASKKKKSIWQPWIRVFEYVLVTAGCSFLCVCVC